MRVESEQRRAEDQAKTARRFRQLSLALAAVALLAVAAFVFAIMKARDSQESESKAFERLASQVASKAQSGGSDLDLRLLLAAKAYLIRPTKTVWESLVSGLAAVSSPTKYLYIDTDPSTWSQLAISPNGKLVAASVAHNALQFWRVDSGQPVGRPLGGHLAGINAIAFSQTSDFVASASADGTVILWDPATNRVIGRPLLGHTSSVNGVAFSPNGLLASADNGGTVIIWDIGRQAMVKRLEPVDSTGLTSLAFSPNGNQIATGDLKGTVVIRDVGTSQKLDRFVGGHSGAIWQIAFSPSGTRLVTVGVDGVMMLWDIGAHKPLKVLPDSSSGQWVLSPDGGTVATGADSVGSVALWDSETGRQMSAKVGGTSSIFAVSNDRRTVATLEWAPNGYRIALRQTSDFRRTDDAIHDELPALESVDFSRDGKIVALGVNDGTIFLQNCRYSSVGIRRKWTDVGSSYRRSAASPWGTGNRLELQLPRRQIGIGWI